MAATFALIPNGRIVQLAEQIDATSFLFHIHDAVTINHVTVFLTGEQPLPAGYGAKVHFRWPDKEWQHLGFLHNQKPSSIFKLVHSRPKDGSASNIMAEVGISIETEEAIAASQTTTADTSTVAVTNYQHFAAKMLEHMYNYMTSFSMSRDEVASRPSQQFVPVSVINEWQTVYKRKLEKDPFFWK